MARHRSPFDVEELQLYQEICSSKRDFGDPSGNQARWKQYRQLQAELIRTVVNSTKCNHCGAAKKHPCVTKLGLGAPYIHSARKLAYKQ